MLTTESRHTPAVRPLARDHHRSAVVRALVVVGLGLSGSLWPVERAGAQQTFLVTHADDGGTGSLRTAMGLANLSAGADTIRFDTAFFGTPRTIRLTGPLPPIDEDLTIDGPGANLLTVDGDRQGRPLQINGGTVVNLSGLTITGGHAGAESGGGILNAGDLTVTNCHITGNVAAFGGGIGNDLSGSLILDRSTLSNNTATGSNTGGGIASQTSVTVTHSTISGNRVLGDSGGNAGGLRLASGTIENSTITNNTAAGPNSAGGLRVNIGTVTLRNDIIAENTNNSVVPDVATISGTVSSGGYNFIGNRGALSFNGTNDRSGDAGTPLDPLLVALTSNGGPTPVHAPLAQSPVLDQGFRFGATNDQRGTDGRFDIAGITAPPAGDESDIGAVEMQALIVTNADDGGPGSLRQAVTDANFDANPNDILFDGSVFNTPLTIRLSGALPTVETNLNIIGPGANLLTLDARNLDRAFVLSGSGRNIAISDLTIRNGKTLDNGGAIMSTGSNLTLTRCAIINSASGAGCFVGGGVFLDYGVSTFTDCTFSGNRSECFGGAVSVQNNASTFNRCTFSGNTSGSYGGAVSMTNAGGSFTNCTISGNTATGFGRGGAIHFQNFGDEQILAVTNSTIVNNTGADTGGIHVLAESASTASVTLRNSIIANNGGASLKNFAAVDGTATITSLGYNLSSDDGGGFLTQITDQINTNPMLGLLQNNGGVTSTHMPRSGSPALDKGAHVGSSLDQRGLPRSFDIADIPAAPDGDDSDIGAVEVQAHIVTTANDDGDGSLRQVIADAPANSDILFDESFSVGARLIGLTGGEILVDKSMTINGPGASLLTLSGLDTNRVFRIASGGLQVAIDGVTISNGRAPDVGGGIVSDSNLTLTNCHVANNRSGEADPGGGVYLAGGEGAFMNCTFSGNVAATSGGGVVARGSNNVTFTGCTLSGNTSGFRGGAVELFSSSGSFTNCTISGNTADGFGGGGGISLFNPSGNQRLAVTNSTIVDNQGADTGGIRVEAGAGLTLALTLRNSIIADSTGPNLSTSGANATIESLGYNLSSDSGGFLDHATDLLDQDPLLGPLRNNGGTTLTHALLAGSPAIDTGSSSGSSSDQRGFARPFDDPEIANAPNADGADIGAFELGTPVASPCVGDCNQDRRVSVDELVLGVNIALSNRTIADCRLFDPNASGTVTVDELVRGVNAALNGCPE